LGFSEENLQGVPINAIKAHEEMEVQFHSILNSVLDRPNWRLSGPQSLSESLRREKNLLPLLEIVFVKIYIRDKWLMGNKKVNAHLQILYTLNANCHPVTCHESTERQ
jgi:hypothetical protein